MHLLLVEDDLDLGSALVRALQGAGLSCEWLRSAADAERFVVTGGHTAVLLDIGLPDGNGLAFLRRWRERGLALPTIAAAYSAD